ncbi:helix-turn-helix domain-containing protein [Microbacterium sp. p3-SID338]|uniref:helix-turn-helix domain-containing protein n=1 Tax=Microbacterium sp. p3-SID338 TaxID=2916214 RepID=UPI0021A91000|nr:helix-turn-helix domain-containing protein [Microbacterium sp. p3-SID338]MCT1397066.1 helix-turn-helix domain-containing protein [Microbacterium sp. p3-SID338]
MQFVTTEEAARRLGVSTRRVVDMLTSKQLAGQKVHRSWLVSEAAVSERERLQYGDGRPLKAATARAVVGALSAGTALPARQRAIVQHRGVEQLTAVLARSTRVERFATRNPELAAEHLHFTGANALERIVTHANDALVGPARQLHGYPKGLPYEELIDHAMLVRDDENARVVLYRFEDDIFPWDTTPTALVAVDAARSDISRVHAVGLEALERMRNQWLATHTP